MTRNEYPNFVVSISSRLRRVMDLRERPSRFPPAIEKITIVCLLCVNLGPACWENPIERLQCSLISFDRK